MDPDRLAQLSRRYARYSRSLPGLSLALGGLVMLLLLLAPPLAAIQAFLLFHETLSPLQFVGFALALIGVLLARTARSGINRTGLTSAKGQRA